MMTDDPAYAEGFLAGSRRAALAEESKDAEIAKLKAELEEAREIITAYWTRTAERARMEGIFQPPGKGSIQARARAFLDKEAK